jgi:hypothetical protein
MFLSCVEAEAELVNLLIYHGFYDMLSSYEKNPDASNNRYVGNVCLVTFANHCHLESCTMVNIVIFEMQLS